MSCKGFYYDNVDGKEYYGVLFTKPTNLNDIKVQHEAGKSNNDVEVVHFVNSNLSKVPQGLTKVFPNMAILDIWSSSLQKVTKFDLLEYKNLRGFYFHYNQLEFVTGDLFDDFRKLEWTSFWGNKLTLVEPNILDDLDKLKYVNFGGNPYYDKLFSIYRNHQSSTSLQEVKNEISQKFFMSDSENIKKFLEKIKERAKKSEHDLIKNNQELSDEIKDLKDKLRVSTEESQNLIVENERLIDELSNFEDRSIVSDLKSHLQDENFKDFIIEIDGREFHVHKFLLAARSSILAQLFWINPEAKNLKLVDIPVKVFEVVLNFLYTDELPRENGTNFLHLFTAASRFGIKTLINFSAENILEQINVKNALEVLELSNKYGHDELRQKAFEEIMKKYPKIDFKDDWAMDTEKIKKMIDIFRKMEALEREFSALKN